MTFDWRTADDDAVEAHFNPRVAVPEALDLIGDMASRSADAREIMNGRLDLRCGSDPLQTFDLFPAQGKALGDPPPAQIFIHGGYWRALDKSDHSLCGRHIVTEGIAHISVNYDLCPNVSLDRIVEQIREAVVHIHGHAGELGVDPNRLHLAGHSAGAHLAAMMLTQPWGSEGLPPCPFNSVAAVSGIYEPEAATRVTVNAEIQLDWATAERNNVLRKTLTCNVPVLVAMGGGETEGWRQQSFDFAEHCRTAGFDCELVDVPDVNHFTLVDPMSTPGEELYDRIVGLMKAYSRPHSIRHSGLAPESRRNGTL